jgi:hypothetical protein
MQGDASQPIRVDKSLDDRMRLRIAARVRPQDTSPVWPPLPLGRPHHNPMHREARKVLVLIQHLFERAWM